MYKYKIITLIFSVVFVFFVFTFNVNAQIVINEIMYDLDGSDSGREWIEIFNEGDDVIDLTNWKFFEANTNHGLVSYQGGIELSPGEYAIISDQPDKFLSDWPAFLGIIFDSSFSLNNTGEALAMKDDNLVIVNQVTYSSDSGAIGDGNSLQKINTSWNSAIPTPGAVNSSSGGTDDDGTEDDSNNENSSSSSGSGGNVLINQNAYIEPTISAKIIKENNITAKVATTFNSKITGYSGELLTAGKYLWNFGDGFTKEEKAGGDLEHIYNYPGEYVVMLEYYRSPYALNFDAIDRVSVKVLSANIIISSIGDDMSVEISNNSSQELDLQNWILKSNSKSFLISKNTIILSNRKLIFSSEITGFTNEDKDSIKLLFPSGGVASIYNIEPLSIETDVETETLILPPEPTMVLLKEVDNIPTKQDPDENTDLSASVINSLEKKDISSSWLFALVGLIIVAIVSVFFLRKKIPHIKKLSDRFTIVE